MKYMNNHYGRSKIFGQRINLQLFAEPAPADPAPADPKPDDPPADPAPADPKPKYTDDDVDKILNRKFAEWEKKQQQKVDEAKRLAEMNAQQKAEYERDQLEKKVQELMKKDVLAEMSKSARAMLQEKDINVSDKLLGMLISEDADTTKGSVESFITLFQEAVSKAVKEALKGEVPKAGGASGMTKEQIMSVTNRAERQRLIKENMHLFK